MSKRDFLLEIGLEELPARFVTSSIEQLKEKVESWLKEERLVFDSIRTFATPRRLAIFLEGLGESQPDISEEAKGPAKKIAYDDEGNWSKAAQGFARGQGVTTDELFFKEVKGVEYIFANKYIAGKKTVELLPALRELIVSLHFPKNMRWGSNDLRFARPIRWLVAMYGEEVIPFSITGIETGATTYGHRFLGKPIKLSDPSEYGVALLGEYVIADQLERKRAVRNQIESMTEGNGWIIPIDEELLEEVTHLVEYPTALSGGFDEDFLKLPKEVLITSMKEHQRYFPVENEKGDLLPYFITVRNGDHQHLENVAKGNEKVLRARLSDAAFFYNEDQKLNIDDALQRLEQIVYHEELGSVGDKVRRVKKLVTDLNVLLNVDSAKAQTANRIAEISKFDLVTQMVNEFPELQGRMGEVYAELAGESKEVAKGINEHYKPRSAGDSSPSSLEATVVSIAEKLDTIVTCFAIGLIPTGSQDPYALRRQAAGIVQMLHDHNLEVTLEQLIKVSLDVAEGRKLLKRDYEEIQTELVEFFKLRVRALLQENEIQYDIIDAVLNDEIGHIPTVMKKAKVITGKRQDLAFKKVVEALSRVTNIAKKAEDSIEIDPTLFEKEEEKMLFRHYQELKVNVEKALEKGDAKLAYNELASSEPVINQYFDHIMVMAEDQNIRQNRLQQMSELSKVIRSYAQFQSIVFA
jgi:glycyl-tRNA synthetase beta chain